MNNQQQLSILEQDYVEPDRPYSQKELQSMREQNFRSLRIGNVKVHHKNCNHFYLAKYHGRKEREVWNPKIQMSVIAQFAGN